MYLSNIIRVHVVRYVGFDNKRDTKMRNWAGLLQELLCLICKRVDTMKDLVAFGGVCSPWRCVAVEQNLGQPLLPFPWLMLAENQNDDSRDFYSVTEDKIYSFELPELRGKMCMETKGWIVTASDKGEMALVHPLTHACIPLPHQNTSSCYHDNNWMEPLIFVQRVVLSSLPRPKNERDCVVMILHGTMGHVGFCRLGDKNWTVVENNHDGAIQSLEYYKGKFYVVDNGGDVWEYDVIDKFNGTCPISSRKLEVNFGRYMNGCQSYLVESAGSLLVVFRDGVEFQNNVSSKFWVFETDLEHKGYKEVRSLGSRALFLGHSASLSVDTIWYPELTPNCIYFTDDCFEVYLDEPEGGGTNMGVYNFGDGSVQPYYSVKSLSLVCPPGLDIFN